MYSFTRRTNYSQNVLEEAKKLLEKGVLVVPGKDCMKGYWKGLVLISRLTDNCYNLIGDARAIRNYRSKFEHCEEQHKKKLKETLDNYPEEGDRRDKKQYFTDHFDDFKDIVENGMVRDRERASSQIISLQNMSFEDDAYSVCGWEMTVPQNDVRIPKEDKDDYKKPEIDLVLVNPSKKEIILVEYKCQGSSMLAKNQGLKEHLSDYLMIRDKDPRAMDNICRNLLGAYNVYRRIKGKTPIDVDPAGYTKKIGFLFVDRVDPETGIEDHEYQAGMDLIREDLEKLEEDACRNLVYIRAEGIENLKLDGWREVYGSDFKRTVDSEKSHSLPYPLPADQGLSGKLL